MNLNEDVASTLETLFVELADGAPPHGAYVLNGGDEGLLNALDSISAEAASKNVLGGATVAAHVAHVQYSLALMNQWARRGGNPFANADWTRAWQIGKVTEEEWKSLRNSIRTETEMWREVLSQPREVSPVELNGLIGSIVHLGYHMGALRQIEPRLRGPQESADPSVAEAKK